MRTDRQQTSSSQRHTRCVSHVQVREAYLQFMMTIAKMIREDKNMSKEDSFVQEEMTKVMELETEIANVSTETETFSGCCDRESPLLFSAEVFNTAENPWRRRRQEEADVAVLWAAQKSETLCRIILLYQLLLACSSPSHTFLREFPKAGD